MFSFQSPMGYNDLFEESWRAFTDHPIKRLSDYDGKRVRLSILSFSGWIGGGGSALVFMVWHISNL